MLVLQRKVGEEVVLTVAPSKDATTIVVKLMEIRSKALAKIGLEAPPTVSILRAELVNPKPKEDKSNAIRQTTESQGVQDR